MDEDLSRIHERVMQAHRPEDAFKELSVLLPPRLLAVHLKPEMDEMLGILDDTKYSSFEDKEAARTAREKLQQLYDDALAKAARGLYALDDYSMLVPARGRNIVVDGMEFAVGEKFHIGEQTTLYKGRIAVDRGSAGVVMRLANTADDSAMVLNEIRLLDILHRADVGYWRNVPYMLARFSAGDRVGIITRYFSGLTLEELRANRLHRNGLDQRHMVWIMDRMLGLMWYYHTLGIIHGNIAPDKIRIRPSNHTVFLTGWRKAVFRPAITGERITASGGIFEAPEVRDSGEVGPWTDIYCLGKTLIWLVGGDPYSDEMPDSVEPKIRQFLRNMVWKHPKRRPHDAKQLYDAQNRLKDSLWERRFLHLNVAKD
ncbi:MAG: protein kinase family protein [Candidatus Pacebacteria bacterium]|nr:protein kinase family protein [Candidatus Paceibacterota bacterium]